MLLVLVKCTTEEIAFWHKIGMDYKSFFEVCCDKDALCSMREWSEDELIESFASGQELEAGVSLQKIVAKCIHNEKLASFCVRYPTALRATINGMKDGTGRFPFHISMFIYEF